MTAEIVAPVPVVSSNIVVRDAAGSAADAGSTVARVTATRAPRGDLVAVREREGVCDLSGVDDGERDNSGGRDAPTDGCGVVDGVRERDTDGVAGADAAGAGEPVGPVGKDDPPCMRSPHWPLVPYAVPRPRRM